MCQWNNNINKNVSNTHSDNQIYIERVWALVLVTSHFITMDGRTRKVMAKNGYLHTRSNVARLYLPRKEGLRRGKRANQHRGMCKEGE